MGDTKDFFNRSAAVWDSRRTPNAGKIEMMLTLSDIRQGSVILDAGCGTGMLVPYLLKHKPSRVVAVDFAKNMVAEAKRKYKDPRVEFICSDIADIDPEGYAFDYCFFFNAFPHFKEHKALVSHISRLMAPGGRVTVSHTRGIKSSEGDHAMPGMPARAIVDVLSERFRPDVIVDNNVLLMVSAVVLNT